jgi:hypothetical protein
MSDATESSTVRLASSVVEKLAQSEATQADLDAVRETLRKVGENPRVGTPVPFASADLRDIYLTWTPDKKWQILYQTKSPGIYVVRIERETGR